MGGLFRVAWRNAFRNRVRALLTIVGGSTAILAFVLIRTVLWSWTSAAEYAAKDRIATRHKVTFIMQLPKKYIDGIRSVDGVKSATWMNWFGARDPRRPDEFFANMAVDPESFLTVYSEVSLKPEDQKRWMEDKQGAIVGDVLAKKLGLKVGDKITLRGTIYPGDWEFNIDGVYTATAKSIDRSQFLFHWDYLDDGIPERRRGELGWVVSRVDDAKRSSEISAAIDRMFDEKDVQTTTMSERQMNISFIAMVSGLLKALDAVSFLVLLIMMLILGNTIAMGVRERTREYAVLRAVGFTPAHIVGFIVIEALVLGLLIGVVGVALSIPIVESGMGRFLEENMGSYFPYFRIATDTKIAAVGLAMGLGAVAALIPAILAGRLKIVDALRRVA